MVFTKKELNLLIPEKGKHNSQEEFLGSLLFDNDGVDYGDVFSYDAEEEKELNAFMRQLETTGVSG